MTLYRTYRPQNFADLVGQDHIRDTLVQAVKEGRVAQAYLFTGPRGTGKTTTARLIAKAANCQGIEEARKAGKEVSGEPCGKCASCLQIAEGRAIDIIEIDAASNRSIEDIRALREQVRFAPANSKYKVYIIDEVHMLTREAFNALLKTLEEPPSHAIFILATTDPHKVLPTIISRTQRFDFKRIALADLVFNLKKVVAAEGLEADDEALGMIATLAEGGGRDSLSLLEQVIAFSKDVSLANVKNVLGIAEISQIISLLRAIFNSRAEEGLKIAHSLFVSGSNLSQLNASILDVLRKMLTLAIAGKFLATDTEENKGLINELFGEIEVAHGPLAQKKILAVIRSFIEAGKMMKETIDPLVAVEVAIVESVEAMNLAKPVPIPAEKPLAGVLVKSTPAPKEITKPEPRVEQPLSVTEEVEKKLAEKKTLRSEAKPVEEVDEPVAGDPNAAPLSDLPEEVWDNVIVEVKKENSTLAALLRDAKPMTVEEGKLVLGVRFKFHKDKISEAKNVKVLEGVICNVTGNSCRVYCEIANFAESKKKESHSDEELASEAEKVFGG